MSNKTTVATIFALNYYSKGITMLESVNKFNPDIELNILISDKVENKEKFLNDALIKKLNVKVTFLEDLELRDFENLAFKYDMVEFCTCVKPKYLLMLADEYDKIIYLDPDIMVYAVLEEIQNLLDVHNIVLTPHISGTIEEGISPATDFLRNGIYNLGFIAVKNADVVKIFLKWWHKKLMNYCFCDSRKSLAWDQKLVDFVPALFDGVYVLRSPNYNVAFWNIQGRYISEKNSTYYVNNDYPLVFVHYSHFNINSPNYLFYINDGLNLLIEDRRDLSKITSEYVSALRSNTNESYAKKKYRYNYYDNGEIVKEAHRKLYNHLDTETEEYNEPFNTKKTNSFYKLAKMFEDIDVSAL